MAAPAVLVTVRAADALDPTPYELRLRSELATEGIEAIVADPASIGSDPKQAAARFGTQAVLDVTITTTEIVSLVSVADTTYSLEVTRNLRMSNQQRDAVALFALRTVDFFLGARLELEQQRRARQTAAAGTGNLASQLDDLDELPKPKPATTTSVPLGIRVAMPETPRKEQPAGNDRSRAGLRFQLSMPLLLQLSKSTWAIGPGGSVAWRFRSGWAVGAGFSGPLVNHIRTNSNTYSIRVDQLLAMLELRRAIALSNSIDFEPHLGFGGSRFRAEGMSDETTLAVRPTTAWSLCFLAGGSFFFKLGQHWGWSGEITGMGRFQAPRVIVDDRDLAGDSRWNLLVRTGPVWSF